MFSTRVRGRVYYTNEIGCGIFTERRDGTDQQHIGTLQTPRFRNAKALGAWIRRHLEVDAL